MYDSRTDKKMIPQIKDYLSKKRSERGKRKSYLIDRLSK